MLTLTWLLLLVQLTTLFALPLQKRQTLIFIGRPPTPLPGPDFVAAKNILTNPPLSKMNHNEPENYDTGDKLIAIQHMCHLFWKMSPHYVRYCLPTCRKVALWQSASPEKAAGTKHLVDNAFFTLGKVFMTWDLDAKEGMQMTLRNAKETDDDLPDTLIQTLEDVKAGKLEWEDFSAEAEKSKAHWEPQVELEKLETVMRMRSDAKEQEEKEEADDEAELAKDSTASEKRDPHQPGAPPRLPPLWKVFGQGLNVFSMQIPMPESLPVSALMSTVPVSAPASVSVPVAVPSSIGVPPSTSAPSSIVYELPGRSAWLTGTPRPTLPKDGVGQDLFAQAASITLANNAILNLSDPNESRDQISKGRDLLKQETTSKGVGFEPEGFGVSSLGYTSPSRLDTPLSRPQSALSQHFGWSESPNTITQPPSAQTLQSAGADTFGLETLPNQEQSPKSRPQIPAPQTAARNVLASSSPHGRDQPTLLAMW